MFCSARVGVGTGGIRGGGGGGAICCGGGINSAFWHATENVDQMLIRTKFLPPRLTRTPVAREAVLRTLSAGMVRPLTLIKAPAGFGKTTLLTAWRELLLEAGVIVAWLTLDQDDNEESRFVDYLTAAITEVLGQLNDETPEQLGAGKMVSVKVQLTSLVNMLATLGREVVLVLDDYDKITDATIHGHLAFLLGHIPANLHVVLACRAQPALNVALFRVRNQLVEIDAESLRFDLQETADFFATSSAVKLTPQEVTAMHQATEGWVAGMQIAALAMPAASNVDRLIASFPGHSKALNDYLTENVLSRMAPAVIDFMLRTSVVERLSGELCERIVGSPGAKGTLEWLVGQNLFLQPLDEQGQWYRYHALFADFLRGQLRARLPDELKALHLRAAEWYAEHALWAEAVRHAIDASDLDLAAESLEQYALAELRNSRILNFRGWIAKLPPHVLAHRPRLLVVLIWIEILTMRPHEAFTLVSKTEALLQGRNPAERQEMMRVLQAQSVSILATQDLVREALERGQAVWQERFAAGDGQRRDFDWGEEAFLNVMIHLYRKVGDLDAAQMVSEFYVPADSGRENLYMLSYRASLVSALRIHQGKAREGARLLEDALELCEQRVGRRSAAASVLAASLAELYYDWDRLEAVEDLLGDRLDIIDDVCWLEPVQSAYLSLIRIKVLRAEFETAHGLLTKCETLADQHGWTRLLVACCIERIKVWLAQDHVKGTEHQLVKLRMLLDKLDPSRPEDDMSFCMADGARARLLLHTGRHAEAAELLKGAIEFGQQRQAMTPQALAQLRVLQVAALYGSGQVEPACRELSGVLVQAEESGAVRLLADAGGMIAPVLELLHDFEKDAAGSDYLSALFRALGVRAGAAAAQLADAAADGNRIRPENLLSSRECDVLALVGQKLSNKQIARKMFITPETVKWHLKNIYRKLGVSDRQQAVERGAQLH
ncbi:MAG TPA: LuxR C-terminal-related transcriptional regulator [Macromonas sp.]|nr:LuxR C-terminal-related transcriptional regulator [Macromonas sp.]